jgi:putative transposase
MNQEVTVRFQADNLGEVHILVPDTDTYMAVPALDIDYARGLTLWQHTVCRRYAKRKMDGRTDVVALAEAKYRITELVLKDFNRKGLQTRNRSHRFLEGRGETPVSAPPTEAQPASQPLAVPKRPAAPPAPLPNVIPARNFTPMLETRRPDGSA